MCLARFQQDVAARIQAERVARAQVALHHVDVARRAGQVDVAAALDGRAARDRAAAITLPPRLPMLLAAWATCALSSWRSSRCQPENFSVSDNCTEPIALLSDVLALLTVSCPLHTDRQPHGCSHPSRPRCWPQSG